MVVQHCADLLWQASHLDLRKTAGETFDHECDQVLFVLFRQVEFFHLVAQEVIRMAALGVPLDDIYMGAGHQVFDERNYNETAKPDLGIEPAIF